MSSGDTVAGNVKVVREDSEGNVNRILGPFDQGRVDYDNNDLSADNKLYVNVSQTDRRSKPTNAESVTNPDAVFFAGEVLKVQHKADSSPSNKIDYDRASAFEIDVLEVDQNRGSVAPATLRATDNELSANVSASTSSYVTFFEFTVPDRTQLNMAGRFGAAAVEA